MTIEQILKDPHCPTSNCVPLKVVIDIWLVAKYLSEHSREIKKDGVNLTILERINRWIDCRP